MSAWVRSVARVAALAAATATAVATGWGVPPGAPAAGDTGGRADSRVIVLASGGDAGAARDRVAALGGTVTRDLPLVGGFAAAIPERARRALTTDPAVRSVTDDTTVRVSAAPGAWQAAGASAEPTSVYTRALKADDVWRAGERGEGVTVAVLDTGVSEHRDLAGRLVTVQDRATDTPALCKNLSGEATCHDQYGHGTFVAGVVAGDGASSGGTHSGVAPGARVLAVKVAGASGATDVSNVLAAIQWVVSFKSRYGIGVLNLSMSTDSVQSYRSDPFNYAVERAWDAGIVVVVSASNRGPDAATISKPGDDPLVITVGATDDRGTAGLGNDEVPDFTARGPTPSDGLAKPDVVAPGSHLVSLRSPGSTIDGHAATIGGAYHRGSGTSFSAAAVSGAAALILGRNPGMAPNAVKFAVLRSARALAASSDPMVIGAGHVDAAAAALSPPAGSANAGVVRSTGTGSLSASRGHVEVQTLSGTVVNGTLTAQLLVWDPAGYLIGWNPTTWYTSTWAVTPFLAVTWSEDDWPGRNWGGRNWGGGNWEGSTFAGTRQSHSHGTPTDGAIWYGAWG